MDFGFIVAGFLVGFLVGLTGVGGGSLMTPILLLFFHIKPAFAVGTDLLYASITKSVGIFAHGKLGNIDWRIVKLLAAGSVPASIGTILFLRTINVESNEAIATIKFSLGVALIVTSAAVLLRAKLMSMLAKETLIPQPYVAASTVFTYLRRCRRTWCDSADCAIPKEKNHHHHRQRYCTRGTINISGRPRSCQPWYCGLQLTWHTSNRLDSWHLYWKSFKCKSRRALDTNCTCYNLDLRWLKISTSLIKIQRR